MTRPLDDIQKPEDVPEYEKAISLETGSKMNSMLKRRDIPDRKSPWDKESKISKLQMNEVSKLSMQSKLKLHELKDLQ